MLGGLKTYLISQRSKRDHAPLASPHGLGGHGAWWSAACGFLARRAAPLTLAVRPRPTVMEPLLLPRACAANLMPGFACGRNSVRGALMRQRPAHGGRPPAEPTNGSDQPCSTAPVLAEVTSRA